jgi:hypothetical protein
MSSPSESSFSNSLPFGKQYEGVMSELIKDRHTKLVQGPNKKHSEWDIMGIDVIDTEFDDDGTHKYITTQTTYESKADTKTITTGNIAIEFRCSGVDSGIRLTTADYWFYFVHNADAEVIDYYEIPTDEIRAAIADLNPRVVRGGDNNNAEMYLIGKQHFEVYRFSLNKKSITEENRRVMYKIYDPQAPPVYFNVEYKDRLAFKAYGNTIWNPSLKKWGVSIEHPEFDAICAKFSLFKCTRIYRTDDELELCKINNKLHELNVVYKKVEVNKKCDKCGNNYDINCSVRCYGRE